MRTRYSNLLRNVVWLHLHERAIDLADVDALFYLSLASTLSKKIRCELAAMKRATSSSIHEEGNVKARYSDLLARCQDEMAQVRECICEICNRLCYPQNVCFNPIFTIFCVLKVAFQVKQAVFGTLAENCPAAIPSALLGSADGRIVEICFACLRAVKANGKKRKAAQRQHLPFVDRVPPHAVTNKLEVIDPPPQLCSLNYIEELLIKRVRPLQVDCKVFCVLLLVQLLSFRLS